ncbi:hypothetical protein AIOL_000894 [Candidatus Rhodobacter oscarellae]|uniref:Uncharacterized protein n=1 Tax=Candidatus Rhodobacter oscarellae TaxID=1675527 RepID=A0A0J9EDE5_9RHOB|nr:hypothetical protein [Candidatus Rhodobacter lobularis]KMW60730.1 hypothetical protein AIOL_000894 [Candidatus Rhodobacter lobularis]
MADGADAPEIARVAAEASKLDLSRATADPIFQFISGILVELPLMARSPEFHAYLGSLGIAKDEAGEVSSLLSGISRAIDQEALTRRQSSDIGGMAKSALIESLALQMRDKLPSLFEPTAQEVRKALADFSSGSGFAALARDFFARLTYRSLDYYLSRELANHTGAGERFADDAGRVEFQQDLAQHTFEASKIVEAFAGGWYGKTVWKNKALDQEAINGFTAYAFKKLRSELGRRENA